MNKVFCGSCLDLVDWGVLFFCVNAADNIIIEIFVEESVFNATLKEQKSVLDLCVSSAGEEARDDNPAGSEFGVFREQEGVFLGGPRLVGD